MCFEFLTSMCNRGHFCNIAGFGHSPDDMNSQASSSVALLRVFFANKMNLLSSRIWHTFNYRFSCYNVIMKVFLMWMVLLVGSRTMWIVVIEYFWFVSRVGRHRIPHPDATHIHAEHIDMGFQSYFISPCGYVSSCLHSCTELHQWQYWEC